MCHLARMQSSCLSRDDAKWMNVSYDPLVRPFTRVMEHEDPDFLHANHTRCSLAGSQRKKVLLSVTVCVSWVRGFGISSKTRLISFTSFCFFFEEKLSLILLKFINCSSPGNFLQVIFRNKIKPASKNCFSPYCKPACVFQREIQRKRMFLWQPFIVIRIHFKSHFVNIVHFDAQQMIDHTLKKFSCVPVK